jgi:hypothetical protein
MDQKGMIKQVIDFQKNTFNNSFNAIVMLQEQSEKMIDSLMSQAPWVTQDFKKAMGDWISTYKKGREEFKHSVDENFKRVEDYFTLQDRPQTKTKQQ